MRAAVDRFRPDLILCPMLTQVIPHDLWESHPCLILHPGIVGDRGGHSLDRAILDQEPDWGVTVVEAAEHVDSGPIWATWRCRLRAASKSSLYRDEIADGGDAGHDWSRCSASRPACSCPRRSTIRAPPSAAAIDRCLQPEQRRIDWSADPVADDPSQDPLRRRQSRRARRDRGPPGPPLRRPPGRRPDRPPRRDRRPPPRRDLPCRDRRRGLDHPPQARRRRQRASTSSCPRPTSSPTACTTFPSFPSRSPPRPPARPGATSGTRSGTRSATVNFRFYNGAMGTDHCRRLAAAWHHARQRPTRVIVLAGGRDFFSNGIHLNLIEAAADPAAESWRNINAMNDLVHAILTTTDRLTIAALYGSAGAGGVMLALAADRVLARAGIVLNPHYKAMGGLYGSEYWTYSLPPPGRPGESPRAHRTLPAARRPRGPGDRPDRRRHPPRPPGRVPFRSVPRPDRPHRRTPRPQPPLRRASLAHKQATRERDERLKPLQDYRLAELAEMKKNFWGADRSYHLARSAFVRKQPRPGHLPCYAALATARAEQALPPRTTALMSTPAGAERNRSARRVAAPARPLAAHRWS